MSHVWSWGVATVLLSVSAATAGEWPTKRPPDDEVGKQLYERHCLACHGKEGKGKGPMTKSLVFDIPDLTDAIVPGKREVQSRVIVRGLRYMPAFGESFDKEDAERILGYMESFSSQPTPRRADPREEEARREPAKPAREAAPAPGQEE